MKKKVTARKNEQAKRKNKTEYIIHTAGSCFYKYNIVNIILKTNVPNIISKYT